MSLPTVQDLPRQYKEVLEGIDWENLRKTRNDMLTVLSYNDTFPFRGAAELDNAVDCLDDIIDFALDNKFLKES